MDASPTHRHGPVRWVDALYGESAPGAARRAGASLANLLGWMSPGQESGADSRLCPDGSGVELAFVADRPGVRYTVEVDRPDADPSGRSATAAGLLDSLGAPLGSRRLEKVGSLQRGHALRYGAWIGGRHTPRTDAYKLYAEVPEAAAAAAADWLQGLVGRRLEIFDAGARLEMVGCEAGPEGSVEFYGGLCPMYPPTAQALFEALGFGERWPAMLDALQALSHVPLLRRMPASDMGFSVSVDSQGRVGAIGLFAVARTLFGPDGSVRRRLLGIARRRRWELGAYASISAGVDDRAYGRHTMVSLTATRQAGPTLCVGMSGGAMEHHTPAPGAEEALKTQRDDGAFASTRHRPDQVPVADSNAFVTALVLDRMSSSSVTQQVTSARRRALGFLERCEDPEHPGCFGFYPPEGRPAGMQRLRNDVDDTALAAAALVHSGRRSPGWLAEVVEQRLDAHRIAHVPEWAPSWWCAGVYRTWLDNDLWPPVVDCCVNVNVATALRLAGIDEPERLAPIVEMVERGVTVWGDTVARAQQLCPFYPHPVELVYALRRAVVGGVASLADALVCLEAAEWVDAAQTEPAGTSPVCASLDASVWWTSQPLGELRGQPVAVPSHSAAASRGGSPGPSVTFTMKME